MRKSIFWFRRDLRLDDNTGLFKALDGPDPVLPIFIFDDHILSELPKMDPRVSFIYNSLNKIDVCLKKHGSSLLVLKGKPFHIFKDLLAGEEVSGVYTNKDYEPYAQSRDSKIEALLNEKGISFFTFKDQVIFEEDEIMKNNGEPYQVFTPYKNKWRQKFNADHQAETVNFQKFLKFKSDFPELEELGFDFADIEVKKYSFNSLSAYDKYRDYPAKNETSHLGPHLRFGTISIRQVVNDTGAVNETFMNELIWREFFMQILFHFPDVVHQNFRKKYDNIIWRNDSREFEKWKNGQTGFPMVDAGMRELNHTGYMHNRTRMVTAGFLCKHLLIDWRWGEAYFASKLLDYELASNNGNWQWAAGTGCDAAPYFRIFNPESQQKKFDKDKKYIRKWIPEIDTTDYPDQMVDHSFARERALRVYRAAVNS